MRELVFTMVNCSEPTFSAIHGPAVGAGLGVSLLADVSVAGRSALALDGHTEFGVAARDYAAISWPFLCAMAEANYHLLAAKPLSGEGAQRIGLVSICVADDQLHNQALSVAQSLAGPQNAVRWTKQTRNHSYRALGAGFDDSLASECYGFSRPDAPADLAAFREKAHVPIRRKPLRRRLTPRRSATAHGPLRTVQLLLVLMFLLAGCFEDRRALRRPEPPPLDVLGDEFQFTEGPVWLSREDALVFSDIPANTMYRWTQREGISVFRQPSGRANGNAVDAKGRLITAEHNRRVTRTEIDGTQVTIAANYAGGRLNSPNDLAVRANGELYFTDPPFGENASEEQPVRGIYRLSAAGNLELVAGELSTPNGIAFSPDERYLYVSNSSDGGLYRFSVGDQGQLTDLRRLHLESEWLGEKPFDDGLKTTPTGDIYVSGPDGVSVITAEGELISVIAIPTRPANVGWGEGAGETLFVTARNAVYRIERAQQLSRLPLDERDRGSWQRVSRFKLAVERLRVIAGRVRDQLRAARRRPPARPPTPSEESEDHTSSSKTTGPA